MKRRNIPEAELPEDFVCTIEQYNKSFGLINKAFDKMEKDGVCFVLRPHLLLFNKGKCSAIQDSKLILSDQHHITPRTSIETAEALAEQIIPLIRKLN